MALRKQNRAPPKLCSPAVGQTWLFRDQIKIREPVWIPVLAAVGLYILTSQGYGGGVRLGDDARWSEGAGEPQVHRTHTPSFITFLRFSSLHHLLSAQSFLLAHFPLLFLLLIRLGEHNVLPSLLPLIPLIHPVSLAACSR